MLHTRYAIYFLPPPGDLAAFGASWLGWDVVRGQPAAHPTVAGIQAVTETPRKYGFHGTLKPPFRLADGQDVNGLSAEVAALAARTAPAHCDTLALSKLGRFLALTPVGDPTGIARLAAVCVTELDRFRAPPTAEELAKRRARPLSPRQDELLQTWGYPHVLDHFRFHLTLTGPLPKTETEAWRTIAADHLPPSPTPFEIAEIALVGERPDGHFEELQRYALAG